MKYTVDPLRSTLPATGRSMTKLRAVVIAGSTIAYSLLACVGADVRRLCGGPPVAVNLEKATISHDDIQMPVGRILLVRQGQWLGAILFVKVVRPQGLPAWQCCAQYESWFQQDGTGDLSKPNATKGSGTVAVGETFGLHPFVGNKGNRRLPVGPLKFSYGCPTWVSLYPYRAEPGYYGAEFAPTRWVDVRDVRVFDSRLVWYRYDKKLRLRENEVVELVGGTRGQPCISCIN